tara:strand:- start:33 stop:440 length:408 start_codon:yes stop_codon:yes gene_type:complete
MLTWLAFKTFVKKAWLWIKTHWYVPALIIYTVVLHVLFKRDSENIIKMMDASKESYEKQLEAVDNSYKEEIRKRDDLILKYQESLKKIEEEYKIKINDLSRKEKEEVVKIVEDNKETPDVLAKELSRLFGTDYVE